MTKRTKNTRTSAQQPKTRKKGRTPAGKSEALGEPAPASAQFDGPAGDAIEISEPIVDAGHDSPTAPAWLPVEGQGALEPAVGPGAPTSKRKRTCRAQVGGVASARGTVSKTSSGAARVRSKKTKNTPDEQADWDGGTSVETPQPVAKRKRAKPDSDALSPATQPSNEDTAEKSATAVRDRTGTVGSADVDASPAPQDSLAEPQGPNEPEVATPVSTLHSMEAVIAELAGMNVRQLVKRHVEMLGKAPRIKNRTWLQRKLAWYEQTKRYGGLSTAAKKRLDQLMAEIQLPLPISRSTKDASPAPRSADDLPLGTRLERKWRDRVIVATRIEAGWDCEGKLHRTLSGAAKAVTGSHVSGPAFFGLWKPKGGAR
jgi:hypothetical protein